VSVCLCEAAQVSSVLASVSASTTATYKKPLSGNSTWVWGKEEVWCRAHCTKE